MKVRVEVRVEGRDTVRAEITFRFRLTGPDIAVAKSSANGLVATGFASRYRL